MLDSPLHDVARESFITHASIPIHDNTASSCNNDSLGAINRKLVWPVIALFPTKPWAQALNRWRWKIVLEIVHRFVQNPSVDYVYTKDANDTRVAFDLDKHVGGAHKLFVRSDTISMNCSTKVDSDVDITFSDDADVFVAAVKDVLGQYVDESLAARFESVDVFEMQTALAVMFDVEFFSKQHAFEGTNATVNRDGKVVPVLSETTWVRSQTRLTESGAINIALDYPVRDMYRDQKKRKTRKTDRTRVDDTENAFIMASDGYYTRPAFMYVAVPNSKANKHFSNLHVVRNSFRALIMVVLENLGFAMEYVDPHQHGLCPTMQNRAKKIAKYADRIAKAMRDANSILRKNGVAEMSFVWWETAGKGREDPNKLREAFGITGDVQMKEDNKLRPLLESQVRGLIDQLRIKIRDYNAKVMKRGGGGDDAGNLRALVAVGVLATIVASVLPR